MATNSSPAEEQPVFLDMYFLVDFSGFCFIGSQNGMYGPTAFRAACRKLTLYC